MSKIPEDLRYTKEHEWARLEPDGQVTMGLTDFAQKQLVDVVYLDLPEVGATVSVGEPMGEVESTKSVSDIYPPVSGEVNAVNGECRDNPAAVNQDPYGEGWLITITPSDPSQFETLLSGQDYGLFLQAEAGEEDSS